MSRNSRTADARAAAQRAEDIAAVVRLNRYVAGASASVEPADVRRVLLMLHAALEFNPKTEVET